MKLQPDKSDVQTLTAHGPGWVAVNNERIDNSVVVGSRGERFAWDCYRRFIQMFSAVVMDLDKSDFEHVIEALKHKRKVKLDTELTAADLESLVGEFKRHVRKRTGRETPAIELIVCPECRAMRRMVLPVNVGAPFRVLSKADRSRSE